MRDDKLISSFAPIADSSSKVLILGTMPGKVSLARDQYYAHPRNAFWPLMFDIFRCSFSDDYSVRTGLLLANGIALWDVLKSCKRQSSLDQDIVSEQPNDFEAFFRQHSTVRAIIFNGQPAARYFKKHHPSLKIEQFIFPSTSPAHAVPYSEKFTKWQKISSL